MASILFSQLLFTDIADGASATLPHNLNRSGVAETPDRLFPGTSDFDLVADDFGVTVTNNTGGVASVVVMCELIHSISRSFGVEGQESLPVRPFVPASGGGGGGGGITVPHIIQTGDGTAAADVDASVVIAHGAANGGDADVSSIESGLAVGDSLSRGAASSAHVTNDSSGGIAHGFADGDGALAEVKTGTGSGAFAGGFAKTTALAAGEAAIRSSGHGASAQGYAMSEGAGFSLVQASGPGSFAQGHARGNGILLIESSASGSFAAGVVESNTDGSTAKIQAVSAGSFAQGFAEHFGAAGSTRIQAISPGAHASGTAYGNVSAGTTTIIEAAAKGSFAHGNVQYGRIIARNNGSFAMGYAYGAYSIIETGRSGSFAMGYAAGGFGIDANGRGGFALGLAYGGIIKSNDNGAFAMGYAQDAAITASGEGSFALGHALGGAIIASANGSMQLGVGTNVVANSLQIGSGFQARDSGQFGGKNVPLTLPNAATSFASQSNCMTITGDVGSNVIATITGGFSGQEMSLIFVDGLTTITDNGTHTLNTIDLSAAFVSAAGTVLKLLFDGTSWYEVSRSIN